MLTDLDSAAPVRPLWSWKKMALGGLLLVTGFTAAIIANDEKLQPYDDLVPPSLEAPPAGTNGYTLLMERWDGLAELSRDDGKALAQMLNGRKPWDAAFADRLLNGHNHLGVDLAESLQRSHFIMPVAESFKNRAADEVGFFFRAHNLLRLKLRTLERSGEWGPALILRKQLNELTRRSFEGCRSDLTMLWSIGSYAGEMIDTCYLLDQLKPDAGYAAELAALWQTEPAIVTAWTGDAIRETEMWRNRLNTLKDGLERDEDDREAWWKRLLVKRNKTLNRFHHQRRNLIRDSFAVRSTAPASDTPDPDNSFGWLRKLDSNYYGRKWLDSEAADRSMVDYLKESMLFQPRALRVRIAIYRWQLQHPGQWPATLQELVPAYLPEIPADPWNGQPLRWDPVTKVIYGVGSDWTPDIPVFHEMSRRWFSDDKEAPGMRLESPPPP